MRAGVFISLFMTVSPNPEQYLAHGRCSTHVSWKWILEMFASWVSLRFGVLGLNSIKFLAHDGNFINTNMFLDEINIWVNRLNKEVSHSPSHGWRSSNKLKRTKSLTILGKERNIPARLPWDRTLVFSWLLLKLKCWLFLGLESAGFRLELTLSIPQFLGPGFRLEAPLGL